MSLLLSVALLVSTGSAHAERALGLSFDTPDGYRFTNTSVALSFVPRERSLASETFITVWPAEPAEGDFVEYFQRKLAEQGGRDAHATKATDQSEGQNRMRWLVQAFRDNLGRSHLRLFAVAESNGRRLTASLVAPDKAALEQATPAMIKLLNSMKLDEAEPQATLPRERKEHGAAGLDGVYVTQHQEQNYSALSHSYYSTLTYYFWVFWPDGRYSVGIPPTGQHFDFARVPASERMSYGTYRVEGQKLLVHRLDGTTDALNFRRKQDGFVLGGDEYRRLVPVGVRALAGQFSSRSGGGGASVWSNYVFTEDGAFSSGNGASASGYGRARDGSSRLIGQALATDHDHGRYRLDQDQLTLRVNDGSGGQYTLLTYPEYTGRQHPKMIFIGQRALLGE